VVNGNLVTSRILPGVSVACMPAASALVALVPSAMDEPVILAPTTGATETIRPGRLLQGMSADLVCYLIMLKFD
jgi:hypothetical protein